jgi:hypothetical protein
VNQYGVFANLVAIAGCLAAAAGAIALTWLKRAKWQPPEEVLPAGAARFSSLIVMIFIAVTYVFGPRLGEVKLAILSGGLLLVSLAALAVTITTNINYSFFFPADRTEANRKLGGSVLTDEAREVKKEKKLNEQTMFVDAQGDKDLVWTRPSQRGSRCEAPSALS